MTLIAFISDLSHHDWFYQYSDDPRAHQSGKLDRERLRNIAERNDGDYKAAFNAAHASRFGKEPDYTPPFKLEKPQ